MSNSTDEWWSIDGTSLHQYGWSVKTFGGSRYDLPPHRGDNMIVAYRPGQQHRPKVADQRQIDLAMFLTGMDPATGASTGDHLLRFNDSWDFLRRLVWKPEGAQVILTRRWFLTINGSKTLLTANALAEVADTMTPTMTGRHRADFTMSLILADPYFYGSQLTNTVNLSSQVTVVNPGHDIAGYANCQIDFVGPLTNPVLTNSSTNPTTWVKYGSYMGSGDTVRLDVGAYTCVRVVNNANQIGVVSNSGSRRWLTLMPGNNTLTLTASAGSGHAVVRFSPPYV